jgi:hypothetical protein
VRESAILSRRQQGHPRREKREESKDQRAGIREQAAESTCTCRAGGSREKRAERSENRADSRGQLKSWEQRAESRPPGRQDAAESREQRAEQRAERREQGEGSREQRARSKEQGAEISYYTV